MSGSDDLIQALMIQIVWRMRISALNVNRKSWGQSLSSSSSSCSEWVDIVEPISLGAVSATVETVDGDAWATISYGGASATTALNGKRLFAYGGAGRSAMTDEQWVDWFYHVLDELDRVERKGFKANGFVINRLTPRCRTPWVPIQTPVKAEDAMKYRLEQLLRDKQRLDWCEQVARGHPEMEKHGLVLMTRAAIDEAMQERERAEEARRP